MASWSEIGIRIAPEIFTAAMEFAGREGGWPSGWRSSRSDNAGQVTVPCPALSDLDDRQPDGQPPYRPEISIAAVKISGAIRIPISDQDAIVNSIKLQIHGDSVDLVTEQALERVRAAWQ